MSADSAKDLIARLELAPHPEGGWYKETWRGPAGVDGRARGTAILFLLEAEQGSHWHRVDADEMWIWQAGDALELLIAETDVGPVEQTVLGPKLEVGQQFQGMVPAGQWQAARPYAPNEHGYTLVSCVVTPGFDFSGFELAPPGWEPGQRTAAL